MILRILSWPFRMLAAIVLAVLMLLGYWLIPRHRHDR